jgi:methyl-accepting chemotaxis protein
MRAAEAAKNTADLIDTTVKKVDSGANLSETTREEFSKVMQNAIKVEQLISEIAVAADEQTLGIGQIGKAVDEMNQVTQKSASNAEESAATSEELNARAMMMVNQLTQLDSLVGGWGQNNGGEATKTSVSGTGMGKKAPRRDMRVLQQSAIRRNVVKPDQVIPMDEDVFQDF